MAEKKNMVHPMVDELRNQSPSSSFPLRRRSSIAQKTLPNPTALEENDDEAERLVRRLEKNHATPMRTNDKRRSLGLGFVSQMSTPQIAEKISQCIKLSAENKINIKNAFSLEMINFMTYMIKQKDANMSNLQVASTSLDVSAKIYGFRVDGVHADILKMIGGLDKQEKGDARRTSQGGEGQEGPGHPEGEAQARPKKKRLNKQKILATVESLRGKIETIDPASLMISEEDSQTTDMLYQATLPFHANSGLYLHPYNDVILDTVDPNVDLPINDTPIDFPKIEDFSNNDMCQSFANFEFLGWSAEEELDLSPDKTPITNDELQFDLDASLAKDDLDEPTDFGQNYFNIEDEENAEGCQRGTNSTMANIVDLREVVQAPRQNKNPEYSYFQDNIDIQWVGPSHWKIRHAMNNLAGSRIVEGCGQGAVRKKKELLLGYNDEIDEISESKFETANGKVKLQAKTARNNWNEDKLTLPQDMHYDSLQCSKYYLCPKVIKKIPHGEQPNATHVSDELADYDYNNENDTTDYCPNIPCEGQQGNNDEIANNADEYDAPMGVCTQGFTSDNLVAAPILTNKISIQYSQRAKKIDMGQLKKCLWKSLTSTAGDKESVDFRETTERENSDKVNGEKKFGDVYKNLPKLLSKANVEALSVPIAFMSLLHIANEKSLDLKSIDEGTDLVIRQN